MSRDQQQKPQATADNDAPIQAKQADEQAGFEQQSLNEVGAKGAQRKKTGGPSPRQQSLGEIGDVVQRRAAGAAEQGDDVQETARAGLAGPGQDMPHAAQIQQSFGRHDVSGVRAHVGGDAAADASDELGARAYATGDRVAFADAPDLHTAAHEAAHTVQQRQGRVQGGLGAPADAHEQEADRVADAVVAGKPAEGLLDGGGAANEQQAPAPGAAVQRKKKVDDDWDVRGPKENRPKAKDFRAVALTRPSEEAQVTLGSRHTQKYWVSNTDLAPAGMSYQWQHKLTGAAATGDEASGERGEGDTNELDLRPRVPGKKKIKSELLQKGPGGKSGIEVEDVTITTPMPKMQGAPLLESISKDGNRRPVLDTFAMGEDLLVTVQLGLLGDNVDADELKAKVDGGSLAYKSARKLGPGSFELRLTPGQVGKAQGTLRVLPLEMVTKEAPAFNLDLNVEDVSSQDDPGSRPQNVAGIKDWLVAPIEEIFKRRHDGIANVYDQEKEKDPPPKTPWWKTLLKNAVMIAINSVTAGLGAKIANAIVSGADSKHFTTEFVKVIFEQSMSTPGQALAEAAMSGGGDGPGGKGGKQNSKSPQRAMGIMFRDAQWAGLGQEAIEAKQRGLATTENMVKRMEAEKPGSGFREALKLDAALKQNYQAAETTQYIETFQRWCSVMAANTLNDADTDKDRNTTDLGKSVDVDKVVRKTDERGREDEVIPGLDKTPGVLNITLAENDRITHVDHKERRSHPLKVTSASIAGLESQDFRATIKDTPISELKMPIVAKFSERKDAPRGKRARGDNKGFVIGRNEAKEYWASEEGDYLSTQTAIRMHVGDTVDIKQAAEHIITQEIGNQTVEPKKA